MTEKTALLRRLAAIEGQAAPEDSVLVGQMVALCDHWVAVHLQAADPVAELRTHGFTAIAAALQEHDAREGAA